MIPTLTKAELEQPRTQAELRLWVDDVHRKFDQTREGIHAVRLNKGELVKQFKEEIYPLALFADAFFRGRSDVRFRPAIGDQRYDAQLIEASTGDVLRHLEITQAFNGYQHHLRMCHIEKYGRAPITARLEKDKASGSVKETWPEAEDHELLLKETFSEILRAVERKSKKRYGPNTSLIVELEDHHIHSERDQRELDDFARSTLVPAAAQFTVLYLVSDCKALRTRLTTPHNSRLEDHFV